MKIITLGNLNDEILSSVGGKARGLDFLKKHGYKIADGFVVTEIDSLGEEENAEIEKAFDALGAERVSVRSSASNEDGGEFSNAGQYETCLDVTKQTLRGAVDKCVASLTGSRASAYSDKFLGGEKAKMNLVVEEMIDADYAGVMFTTDPSDGDCVLIEAVKGKGEQLVSGAVGAFRYSVSKSEFSYEDNGGPSEKVLKRLYEEGKAIAKAYGSESDLEWVVDGDGTLYWLQLRPITALNDCDLDEFNPAHSLDNHLLTSRNIGEMMPGAITPLSISTSVLAIDYGMRNMLATVGVIKDVKTKPDYFASLAVKYHLFIDLSALHLIGQNVMMTDNDSVNLSIAGEYIEDYPKPEGKHASFLVKMVNGIKFAKFLFSSKKAKQRLVALYDNLSFTAEGDIKAIYDEITSKLQAMNDALSNHYVCSSFSGAMNSALVMMLADTFPDKADYQNFVAALLSDIDDIESADILRSLKKLAGEILAVNPDAAAFSDEQLLSFVTDGNNEKINALYNEFLLKHGHRSIKEAELRSKAWKNDPSSLMKNLRTVMLSGELDDEASKAPFDIEEVLKDIKGSKKGALRWIGKNARQAVIDREFSKSNIIKIIDKFKDRYVILAKLLCKSGLLADEDSIYFLSHAEIGKLIDGDTSLKRKALARRVVFKEAEELSFDDICVGMPVPVKVDGGEGVTTLKGISVSRGKVRGRARIVRSFEDAQKIEKGEIMVAPFTDIGWSPYYSVIGGLVTEVGSTLSHGAVVAREYCLPTIVNVKNATKLIKDGDYICVDASAGTVSIESPQSAE
ncbi:MAG: hypothetical protein J1F39_02920 [Clostridiales bacterium]|nr:hypothetical protein [Clostridiales bacterium]